MEERALAHKLLATYHLNVTERAALPQGRIRLSAMVAAVSAALTATDWFPRELKPGAEIGDGAVLERRGDDIWVHEQHESGVMRYGPVQSFRVSDIAAGVRAYVRAVGGAPIDGVPIDWDS